MGYFLLKNREILATTKDGLKFYLSFPQDRGLENIYLYREYEPSPTAILKQIICEGDVIFDIGANIGYYTVLFTRVFSKTICHAFEPSPIMFQRLIDNCKINNVESRVVFNPTALGDSVGKEKLYTFEGLPHGHSSLSNLNRSDFNEIMINLASLSSYVIGLKLNKIDLIKLDVEGAEMMVLRGASHIFTLSHQPVWMIEMNDQTSSAFGHAPSDLLRHLSLNGDFKYIRVGCGNMDYAVLNDLEDYNDGDNVLCFPSNQWQRLEKLKSQMNIK